MPKELPIKLKKKTNPCNFFQNNFRRNLKKKVISDGTFKGIAIELFKKLLKKMGRICRKNEKKMLEDYSNHRGEFAEGTLEENQNQIAEAIPKNITDDFSQK